ncbi:hypothetical protein QPM17_16125 [Marinobacter sp. TBZ242]|uniref:Lipoprotein n=1 Tax=Marinobacter azerbaijanicus TaxID=3050455 RepID=A0ABT7IES7_9GAMM|nr:hypothetical protein [Marinobacter sp. TBZ242]MDL0432669.1 hypothetical protein [Marinobacter sp. TBZ242]
MKQAVLVALFLFVAGCASTEAVNIQKGDGSSFIASAISEGVVLKQSRFQEGEHFEFRAGLLELKRENIEHTKN